MTFSQKVTCGQKEEYPERRRPVKGANANCAANVLSGILSRNPTIEKRSITSLNQKHTGGTARSGRKRRAVERHSESRYHTVMSDLSLFYGPNAGYVLELYERYRQDPDSVDAATRALFTHWN